MKSQSEVGHGKNVANFEDLISRCVGFGATYNPVLNAIKIANMNALKTTAQTALANAISAETALDLAVDNREAIFKPLQDFATRIMSALKGCGASDAIIKDAKTINRKIQGKRAKPIKETTNAEAKVIDPNNPPVVDPKHISAIQLSYDSMIEHYSKLIDLLASVTIYIPNEPELKIAGLNTLLTSMKATNTAHINATTNAISARINRNEILYKKVTGLLDVAQDCKDYVKSVYGSKHPKYKEVSAIQFKRLVKF
jgi:hypothetical protein